MFRLLSELTVLTEKPNLVDGDVMSVDLQKIMKIINSNKFVISKPGLTVEQHIENLKVKYNNK